MPVALNVLALAGTGWLYNRATGHRWRRRAARGAVVPASTYMRADLDAVLATWDETLDIDPDDLDALFCAVDARARRRG